MKTDSRAIATFKHDGKVYLAASPANTLIWNSPQASIKWFKKYYDRLSQYGKQLAKDHHKAMEFKIHTVSLKAIENESFENAVVKSPEDKDKAFEAKDFSIKTLNCVGDTLFYGVECKGKIAESFHNKGETPKLPTKI